METVILKSTNEVLFATRAVSDPAAFGPIYDHYFPRVYNYIRYRARRADVADDLTARTFERALDRIDTFDPERSAFAPWLFAIARNAVNDHLRARRRRRWVSLEWLKGRGTDEPAAEDLLIDQERRERLLWAVSRLSDREQDVLSLKFAAGHTNRQIAGLTGLGESNVGVILHRAVRKLRSVLRDEE